MPEQYGYQDEYTPFGRALAALKIAKQEFMVTLPKPRYDEVMPDDPAYGDLPLVAEGQAVPYPLQPMPEFQNPIWVPQQPTPEWQLVPYPPQSKPYYPSPKPYYPSPIPNYPSYYDELMPDDPAYGDLPLVAEGQAVPYSLQPMPEGQNYDLGFELNNEFRVAQYKDPYNQSNSDLVLERTDQPSVFKPPYPSPSRPSTSREGRTAPRYSVLDLERADPPSPPMPYYSPSQYIPPFSGRQSPTIEERIGVPPIVESAVPLSEADLTYPMMPDDPAYDDYLASHIPSLQEVPLVTAPNEVYIDEGYGELMPDDPAYDDYLAELEAEYAPPVLVPYPSAGIGLDSANGGYDDVVTIDDPLQQEGTVPVSVPSPVLPPDVVPPDVVPPELPAPLPTGSRGKFPKKNPYAVKPAPWVGPPTPGFLTELTGLKMGAPLEARPTKFASGQLLQRLTPSQMQGVGGYVNWAAGQVSGAPASYEDWLYGSQQLLPRSVPKGTVRWAPSPYRA